MWIVIDVDSLQICEILNYKREAIFIYSQNGKSKKIAKGLYLVSNYNSLHEYESFLVNEKDIENLIKQGFEWLQELDISSFTD